MVKRYMWSFAEKFGQGLFVSDKGEYVKYEDYAALQQKLDAIAAENAALKQVFLTKDFSTEVTDVFFDTAVLKIDGDEHYCHQWVDNDSDVIRAVLTSLKEENPTPATDTYLNSVRAEGVEMFGDFAGQQYQLHEGDKVQQKKWKSVVFLCCQYAEQLRSGTHDISYKAG